MTRQCSFTTRGCHFDCEFCSVSPFNGKTTRRRPVQEVVTELQNVQRWIRSELVERIRDEPLWNAFLATLKIRVGLDDGSIVAFVDDLHNSNRAYCRELWTALKPLKIKWGCQSTLFLGDDEEMVKLAAESGCVSVFVGMESLDEDCLDETNKPFNRVQKFAQEIKMFHNYGIMVNPGIVFGFDNDDEAVFERAVDFLTKNQVELAYFNVLTPLPGTALFDRYNNAGRIFDRDWSKYDGKHVVFQPSRMTPEQLQEGFYWANHQFYSLPNIWYRLSGTKQRLIARWEMNRQFRKLVKRSCPKGRLSPLASVLKNLQAKLPVLDTDHLIPSALHALKQRFDPKAPSTQQLTLNIKVKRHDKFAALFMDLEGALDRLNVHELINTIREAAEKAKMDIIVNFEHLKLAAPDALKALVDSEAIKAAVPHVKVRYRKFKDAFETSMQEPVTVGRRNADRGYAGCIISNTARASLYCEQVPVSQIAKEVGTPCYIYSHATFIRHIRAYDSAFKSIPHLIAFAMKANSNLAILRLMAKEGSGVDIVSGGELFRALKAGVPPSKIVFAGVGKNAEEIRDALEGRYI